MMDIKMGRISVGFILATRFRALTSGWLREWENRDSSNPDFSRLNWVDNDGHQDGTDFSWVHLSDTLQGIDCNSPASLDHGDLGWGRGNWYNVLNNLDKGLESLQMT